MGRYQFLISQVRVFAAKLELLYGNREKAKNKIVQAVLTDNKEKCNKQKLKLVQITNEIKSEERNALIDEKGFYQKFAKPIFDKIIEHKLIPTINERRRLMDRLRSEREM